MKGVHCRTAALALVLFTAAEAFAPPSLAGRATKAKGHELNTRRWQLDASKLDNDESNNTPPTASIRSILQRKSKPVTFAIATAASFLSCLPGQQSSLLKPPAAQASAPIVLRPALPKDDPPMMQAMTKAKELKKQRSMEEFDAFMQKCNDIEDSEGKEARDAYEKQYQIDKAAKEAQKVIDLENLKRDLLDEGKDPFTDLDAEREVFLFEHGVDLEKVPGTPHNEQMIKNFRSRGKNKPMFESQRYIVKCQVADLKARGVDPLEHFSRQEVMDKTRAIYKMDDKVASKVAKQYEGLMDKYNGRLSPIQEGEVPFERPSSDAIGRSSLTAKEKRAQEKAAAKAKRAAEKDAKRKERVAKKQAVVDARAKAKADKAAAKGKGVSNAVKPTAESIASVPEEPVGTQTIDSIEEKVVQKETASKKITRKKKGSTFNSIATLQKKVPKQAPIIVVGGGAAAFGYKLFSDASSKKKGEQYRSIMGGVDDDDDFDDDFDDDDDDY